MIVYEQAYTHSTDADPSRAKPDADKRWRLVAVVKAEPREPSWYFFWERAALK